MYIFFNVEENLQKSSLKILKRYFTQEAKKKIIFFEIKERKKIYFSIKIIICSFFINFELYVRIYF